MSSTSSTGANSYKTNVNRTKTKKWVEAKIQSYDGDDWGNEYDDDEEDEPEPQPSSAAIGARYPGQPSHPATRTFSQPMPAEPRTSGPSGFRSPSGPPSLHVQTQQGVAAPSPGSHPGRSDYFPVQSPSSQHRMPDAAEGAAAAQTRFPPRKSSMSRMNAPDLTDPSMPRSSSRPGSSSANQPWMDQRSASPGRAAAPPGKPLPFVRPSDIYRRMEEEKDRERQSMESGRPSMDSIVGRNEGVSSPTSRSSAEQRRRTSLDSHDGSDPARGLRTTLTPVAERKSEYGMEGLLAAQGFPAASATGSALPSYAANPPEPELDVKSERLEVSPESTSPQLPSLARLSGFGDGLFSTSSGQSAPAQTDLPSAKDGAPDRKQPSSVLEGPRLEPNPDIILPSPQKAMSNESEKAGSAQPPINKSHRPSIPGGWVSETPTTFASEQATPLEVPGSHKQTPLSSVENASVSPMSESVVDPVDPEPTTEVKRLTFGSDMPRTESGIKAKNDASGDSFGSPTGKHDDAVASEAVAAGPGFHHTPRDLPPLKTEEPGMSPAGPVYNASPVHYSPATQPTTASTASGFEPTAPLNPGRSVADQAGIVPAISEERKATLSSVGTASPQKESDKLREEIIKSLSASPTTPSASGLLERAGTGNVPDLGEPTRESSYLSGVYDDYLGTASPEQKSLLEAGKTPKQQYQMSPPVLDASGAAGSVSAQKDGSIPGVAPLSPRKSHSPELANRSKRFSWEQGPEQVTLSPLDGPDPDSFGAALTPQVDVAPPTSEGSQLQAEGSGSISHQVSQVSSRAPDEGGLTAIDPPSPVSYVAGGSPKAGAAGPRTSALSLAEEKEMGLMKTKSAQSEEVHPALTEPRTDPETSTQPTVQTKVLSFREILNIGSTQQRIRKLDETRDQFFAMESGLSNWLAHLQAQPDHGGAGTGDQPGEPGGGMTPLSPTGSHPTGQQPYYQQYLSASRQNVSSGTNAARRGSVGGNAQQQQQGQGQSSFGGPSSAQVGAKSKELLQAAGAFGNKGMKSGMKLFNKGKSKLRERTGEKTFF
ncbi:hypothetical protein GGR56DRAFT_465420 [Xylariaceae sp. FL0804]|nr:hypothetical protein GGR56DRAFT_465420 [Xylariaceae sp. FL0804]